MSRIAIAAYSKAMEWKDDVWLKEELQKRGHKVEILDWQASDNELLAFDRIFVSSTWNFIEDPSGFATWLTQCESDGRRRLINASELLQAGIQKSSYLEAMVERFGEAERKEGSVVPTRYCSTSTPHTSTRHISVGGKSFEWLLQELARDGKISPDLIIKPVTSASGKNTYLYNRSERSVPTPHPEDVMTELEAAETRFRRILDSPTSNGVIIQSYAEGVEKGELSLIFIEDTLSHAVRKPPGFKQDESLARKGLLPTDLPTEVCDFAAEVVHHLQYLYGEHAAARTRVDLSEGARGPVLSEVEFVEPSTNLRNIDRDLGSAAREECISKLADAIERRLRPK